MIDYEFKDLFTKQDIYKQLIIRYDNGTITNNEIHSEQFTLEESLCSDSTLRFGACEASSIEFTVSNIFEPLKDKWLDVSMVLDGNSENPFHIGRFKVYSDIPTADRKKRDVTAYDALYDIIHADVAAWYNSVLPKANSTVTLKELRNSFFAHFGIEQAEAILPNDSMTVKKTIEPEQLSGATVLNAICEINGCFGHINRDNQFAYIFLKPITTGVYPSTELFPSATLYPVADNGIKLGTSLIIPPVTYEDYETDLITGLVIRQEENDVGAVVGEESNQYVIQDNFLVYGKSAEDLTSIATIVFQQINGISYRPFETKAVGNPCIEVGDILRIATKSQTINSYVLQRTFSGVQCLRDVYSADGEKECNDNVNSISNSLIQLKGKTNTLTRTVDATISELADLENNTSTRFEQTADAISAEVKRATDAETTLQLQADAFRVSVDTINYKLENDYLTTDATKSLIEVSREGILLDVSKNYYTLEDAETDMANIQSQIDMNESEIALRVKSGEVISAINLSQESIVIDASKIDLKGYVEFTDLAAEGSTQINGANITTGQISADRINTQGLVIGWSNLPGSVASTSEIPTRVSELYNDANYQTSSGVTTIINGVVTTDYVEALKITVKAAQIEDTLTIGQLPGTVAETSDIPTNVSQLSNDAEYQNISGVTTIIDGRITTDYIEALKISVDAAKISGKLTAKQIDATDLHVTSANVDGNFSADKIDSGTIDASIINVVNLSADNITSGTLSADFIVSGLANFGGTVNIGKLNCTALDSDSGVFSLALVVGGVDVGDKIAELERLITAGSVDLSGYVTETKLTYTLKSYVTSSTLSSTLSGYATTTALSAVSSTANQNANDISSLVSRVGTLETEQSSLSSAVTKNTYNIAQHETALQAHTTQISDLKTSLSDYATVDGMKQYVGSNLAGVTSKVSDLETRVSALEAAI